jgi:DNA-binding GntR family transcriptional regulator
MRLQERLLCERYGISRSPLREAYQVLASEGLIEISLNKGAIVTAPTPSLALQNFELLRALELLAVRLACETADAGQLAKVVEADAAMKAFVVQGDMDGFFRANNEVHRQIVLASGNAPLAEAHLLTSRQLIRIQNLSGPITHVASEGVDEHDEILAALQARDCNKAVAFHAAHLATVEDNLRGRLRQWTINGAG